jgi:hypothetical protein
MVKKVMLLRKVLLIIVFVLSLNIVSAQVCTPPPSGMVAWWPGDGNADDMVGSNDGTLFNGATFAAGFVWQAFSLDGVNDYVEFPASPDIDMFGKTTFTADAWVNVNSLDAFFGGFLLNKRNSLNQGGYLWNLFPDGTIFVRVYHSNTNANALTTAGAFTLGNWHHLAFTYNEDGDKKIKIYVDGAEATYASNSAGVGSLTDDSAIDLHISLDALNSRTDFDGLADEIEIFDRALSSSEIAAIFNAGSAGKCKEVVPVPEFSTFSFVFALFSAVAVVFLMRKQNN